MSRGTWSPEARRRAKRRQEAAEHRVAAARGRELRIRSRSWVGSMGGRSSVVAPSRPDRPSTGGSSQPSVLVETVVGNWCRAQVTAQTWNGDLALGTVQSLGWTEAMVVPSYGVYDAFLNLNVEPGEYQVDVRVAGETVWSDTATADGKLFGVWPLGPCNPNDTVTLWSPSGLEVLSGDFVVELTNRPAGEYQDIQAPTEVPATLNIDSFYPEAEDTGYEQFPDGEYYEFVTMGYTDAPFSEPGDIHIVVMLSTARAAALDPVEFGNMPPEWTVLENKLALPVGTQEVYERDLHLFTYRSMGPLPSGQGMTLQERIDDCFWWRARLDFGPGGLGFPGRGVRRHNFCIPSTRPNGVANHFPVGNIVDRGVATAEKFAVSGAHFFGQFTIPNLENHVVFACSFGHFVRQSDGDAYSPLFGMIANSVEDVGAPIQFLSLVDPSTFGAIMPADGRTLDFGTRNPGPGGSWQSEADVLTVAMLLWFVLPVLGGGG